ncbi:MAG: hypothetical protein AUJ57_04970 [Zetaproteobacteria bacterium CG1_02_53_45]|nr:MAG: hypothetical protein AUJ57_04970 [Zetaproteobacteria bacterium CG1_02_53_45]
MLKRVRHQVAMAWLAMALFLPVAADAASLEKIEVASRLGEPFYAEVPLRLEEGESLSGLFIEVASPADYRIFEVYRDPVLSEIRADVASDQRGTLVKLSSRSGIKAPFFNLVLKVRYGRVAHFKKFAVFIEAAKSIQTAADKPSVATVQLSEQVRVPSASVAQDPLADTTETDRPAQAEQRGATDDWARADRYGPIVYGDVLSTVASRLRVDHRYKPYQVMAALYEKNKSKFDNENMNLLKAGSFLEVPTAAEIEQRSAKEAYALFAQHEKQWKELTEKPRYAAVEEAQRTRYSNRVSVGEQARGSAAAPVLLPAATKNRAVADSTATARPVVAGSGAATDSEGVQSLIAVADDQQAAATQALPTAESNSELAVLEAKNEALQQQLLENQKSIEALNSKIDDVAGAASTARVEKLEVLLVRLQAELEKSNKQAGAPQNGPDWVIWLLAALVTILLGAVAVLMRREPAHPADEALRVEEKAAVEPVVEALETVAGDSESTIENEDREQDVFDSIASFSDDLTDTDTAEMEPFDASMLDEDPDPNVDYISEADVYARYGMDDEALHQLNLALRLQSDNLAAHIKKAQLLRRTGAVEAFAESKAEADRVLESAELDQFYAALHEVATGRTEVSDAQPSAALPTVAAAAEPELLPEDDDVSGVMLVEGQEDDGIDFDLSDIDMPEQQDVVAEEPAMEEMDWLHDASFDATAAIALTDNADVALDESHDATGATVTQMFDNLMVEFSDDDLTASQEVAPAASLEPGPAELDFESTLDLASADATQELDSLLSEFTNQDEEVAEDVVPADIATADRTLVIDEEAADLLHLDHLLGDFADDENMFNFSTDSDELDVSVFDQAEAAVRRQVKDDESTLEATQHLDILMNEFAEPAGREASGLDDDLLEQNDSDAVASRRVGIATGHDTTQELNHLLSEFADDENSLVTAEYEAASIEMDHDATQELDHLLSEFAVDEGDAKPGESDHGATQELDHLLSEFSFDEDDAFEPEADKSVGKKSGFAANHSTTQELDQLLSEFSDDGEDDDGKKKG